MGSGLFGGGQDRLQCTDTPKGPEVNNGARAGVPSKTAEKIEALEREVRELRQANEILLKAWAYFAMAELDRRAEP